MGQLPALQVVLPLLMAPFVAMLSGRGRLPWLITTITSAVCFVIAVTLTAEVLETGPLFYEMGGWSVPFGIGLVIGPFAAMMLLVITGASTLALLWGGVSMDHEVGREHLPLLYTSWLMALAGLIGIAISGDAFNIFVFMEISSLASYVLVAAGPSRRALTATFKYLMTGTVGATFYLIGVGYIYMMTGTLNLADMADRLADVTEVVPVMLATGFVLVGLALKAALFPMHAWMPNAYAFAPSAVAVFLAACSTKVALFVLIRFDFLVFQPNLAGHQQMLAAFLIPLCVAAFVLGSTIAVFERDLKRMLGYSSVAQIGYILLGVSLISAAGSTAAIVHMFNHALIKAALFMAAGCLMLRYGSTRLADFAGAGQAMPWTMAAFALAGLSLIGVPLTAGFISKWYLISAVLEQGALGGLLVALILASSLLAVIYIWKVIEVAYFHAPAEGAATVTEAPRWMLLVLWSVVLANFWFGVDPTLPLSLAGMEVPALMDIRP
jgi:multicomponent Na+:H+ antiporter subunit D